MTLMIIFMIITNPFYEANFSSLPMRSLSVFSNPAGLGINKGAEIFGTYQPNPDIIVAGISLANLGLGMKKVTDDATHYEIGSGYKLPGAFSFGYAYQFGDISKHIFGVETRVTKKLAMGYKTTIGRKYHMFGGISIRPFEEYLTLSCDLEYEGIDSIFTYFWGTMFMPTKGMKLYFRADEDFEWNTGLELSFGKIRITDSYCEAEEKISGGILLSAQTYETLMPKKQDYSPHTEW